MLHQEGGDDHARAVRHEAGPPKLAHRRIDDGVARLAAPPGVKRARVVTPGETREFRPERRVGDRRDAVQQMIREFAPAELAQEGFGATVELAARAGRGMVDRVPDLVGAKLAEMQMRRKPRGGVAVERAAVVGIAGKTVRR